jgi:hypothetical protein
MQTIVRFLLGAVVVAAGAAGVVACSSDEAEKPVVAGSGGQTQGPSDLAGCYKGSSACPAIAGTKCFALADNTDSKVKNMRLSQLHVTAPSLLATGAIPTTVVSPAVTLNLPACYLNSTQKGGLFNWLASLDTDTGKLTTGGANVPASPTDGYCFLKQTVGTTMVEPITIDTDFDKATNKFSTKGLIAKLVVPIYTADPNKPEGKGKDPILLPLSNGKIFDVTLTENGNCVGRFKGEDGELDENCQTITSDPKDDASYQWVDGAKLEGTITLEEADAVDVVDLGASLCTLLTNKKQDAADAKGIKRCLRTADNLIEYDKMKSPEIEGDGATAFVTLKASFAASAVKVNETCPLSVGSRIFRPRPGRRAGGRGEFPGPGPATKHAEPGPGPFLAAGGAAWPAGDGRPNIQQ